MREFINGIAIAAIAVMAVCGFCQMSKENKEIEQKVYRVLEQDYMTEDDKQFVKFATDPDEMKEGFVWLDAKHAKLFQEHFGYNR